MSKAQPLTEMRANVPYTVHSFIDPTSEYAIKLHKMGFTQGTPIARAPVAISDPMIVSLRGSHIALRKAEAQAVLVELANHA